MAAIQTLLDNAVRITVDNRRPTASTISRGQHLKTQSRANSVYKFTVGMHPALKYEDYRSLLSEYDATGRTTEEEVKLSNVSGGSWIMNYQGGLDATDQAALTADASSANANLVVNVSATISAISSTEIVKAGDYIQVSGSRYPYQATATVTRGSGSTVTIPLHRDIVTEDGFTIGGQGIDLGGNCTFRVKITQQPTYSIVPGRYIEWDSDMQLMEVLT